MHRTISIINRHAADEVDVARGVARGGVAVARPRRVEAAAPEVLGHVVHEDLLADGRAVPGANFSASRRPLWGYFNATGRVVLLGIEQRPTGPPLGIEQRPRGPCFVDLPKSTAPFSARSRDVHASSASHQSHAIWS